MQCNRKSIFGFMVKLCLLDKPFILNIQIENSYIVSNGLEFLIAITGSKRFFPTTDPAFINTFYIASTVAAYDY
jgi:hypothetical protein